MNVGVCPWAKRQKDNSNMCAVYEAGQYVCARVDNNLFSVTVPVDCSNRFSTRAYMDMLGYP
jgi:hypothetical protein